MRRVVVLLLALVMVGACQPKAASPPRATPRPTARATPRPTVKVAPTPTRKPTPKPKPTPRPARLVLGVLSYDATACWRSGYTDDEGHRRGGTKVRFAVNVTNKGGVTSQPVWFLIDSGDDGALDGMSPGKPAYWDMPGELYVVRGPSVKAGDTVRVRWSWVFFTPFDPHYWMDAVMAGTADAAREQWIGGESLGYHDVWTSAVIC